MDRLKMITACLRLYQSSGLQRLVKASGILRLLGRLGKMEALLPALPDQRLRKELPEVMPAKGKKRGRAGLLLGCVQRFFFPQVNQATARVLSECGYEVVMPESQECCGSLLVHEGDREGSSEFAKKAIGLFDRLDVDVIVVNAAGCGSVMKEYGRLLRNDPAYAEKAETFSRKVRDVSELLARVSFGDRLKELDLTVTYHDACHLAHGQRIKGEPRAVIKMIPGLRCVELEESDFCCGSAGIYNLLYPELAQQYLERKIERIKLTGAQVVVSGNPGCSLQIEKGLREHGFNIRLAHPVELLSWSLQGRVD
jgi:glycolate oxidase iron-sulfur subunit